MRLINYIEKNFFCSIRNAIRDKMNYEDLPRYASDKELASKYEFVD